MADDIQTELFIIDQRVANARAVVPGRATGEVVRGSREESVTFTEGVAARRNGETIVDMPTPSTPALHIARGGFYLVMPTAPNDETVGLCADRSIVQWRQSRTTGQADVLTGSRAHSLSDVMLTPFALTAPAGAPMEWDGRMVFGGPAGTAVEIQESGEITISNAASTTVIRLLADGTIELGGSAALALAASLHTAIGDAIGAAVLAAAPIASPAADGGTAGFTAFQQAWASSLPSFSSTITLGA